ncbi:sulfotransferase family protein [Paramaledivibacter caminithermalis]|uniref:Sulfotransferase domain-containing protein n=1 Tax=Paramaledivibacter caminithermalis (strain DSM 15212 / CIP 107654 / DViRD3) TaxID=1121301 RepID=A0A1M6JUK6_PARC5|nr:sulfotransferase [Paramaledivibacter caminithermalis]SHJ50387.1 Sulfotransferase domain-containing protein [Paramaledivibacter caminithermalis DSM 15212]
MLPNFICPGTQKAATTSLYALLKQHPDIYIPECKETHFFDSKKYYKGLDFYEKKFFNKVKEEKIVGDITPIYMYLEYIPKRIYQCLGKNIKFVFMLRNPIDRAYSNYWMWYRNGYETKTFEDAIKSEKSRINKSRFNKRYYSYIDRGFYAKQIKRYLKFFNKKNMKFVIFEEFVDNLYNVTNEIYDFLEVKRMNKIKFIKLNNNPLKVPPIHISTRKSLLNLYYDDIKELETIINKDLGNWLL